MEVDDVEGLLDGDPWDLPLRFFELHRSHEVGATLRLPLPEPHVDVELLRLVTEGAGFDCSLTGGNDGAAAPTLELCRVETLADTVGPGMRLLMCGLNPSLHSARSGVGYSGPGNRFWPAAEAAGLVGPERDPLVAYRDHRIGMTDLVKRATKRADELARSEHRDGLGRLTRLVEWLQPGALCVVGLSGWRAAVDRHAGPGPQADHLGGRPVYLMPSTSGLNAATRFDDLVAHFTAAAALADTGRLS